MCQGGQGNLQGGMRRPGFISGGVNDPANGGSGYWNEGTSSWGGNYGNQIDPGLGSNPNYTQGPTVGDMSSGTFSYPAQGGVYEGQNPGGFNDFQNQGMNWNDYNNAQNQGMNYNNTQDASTARGNQQGTSTDPFAGISAGRLGQAQRFANAGMFGRAKQQIGLGGGNWGDVGGLLRQQAGETDNYGGDWNWGGASDADVAQAQRFANAGMMGKASGMFGDNWNRQMATQLQAESKANPYVKGSSMGFDWGDASAGRLAKAKEFATAGKMGRAKQMYEKGGGKWSPGIGNQFRAWAKGNK